MNKIETNFEKLNHYQDIETYYPPLDDIKDFLYELFGDRVESQKYIVRTNQKLEQLQSNWNSLREWLESDNQVYFCNQTRQNGKAFETGFKFGLAVVLDKMNELEGEDNDSNV